jgi:hypothetical protein
MNAPVWHPTLDEIDEYLITDLHGPMENRLKEIGEHLSMCAHCQSRVDTLDAQTDALLRRVPFSPLPADLRKRVDDRITAMHVSSLRPAREPEPSSGRLCALARVMATLLSSPPSARVPALDAVRKKPAGAHRPSAGTSVYQAGDVRIMLTLPGGKISSPADAAPLVILGRARAGDDVAVLAGAELVLYSGALPDEAENTTNRGLVTTTHVNDSGNFTLSGLAPGAYHLRLLLPDRGVEVVVPDLTVAAS